MIGLGKADNLTNLGIGFLTDSKAYNADKAFLPGSVTLFPGIHGQSILVIKQGIHGVFQFPVNQFQVINILFMFFLFKLKLTVSGNSYGTKKD